LGGSFKTVGHTQVQTVSGKTAVTFDGTSSMKATFTAPASLSWNSPYTAAVWVLNPSVSDEGIASWSAYGGPTATLAAMMYSNNGQWGASAHWNAGFDMPYRTTPSAGAWHHIALVFDGQVEKVYVDGQMDNQVQKYLNVWPNGPVYLGWSGSNNASAPEYLSGSIASFKMYDVALDAAGITALKNGTTPTLPTPPPAP
jgi:hypothetical protein